MKDNKTIYIINVVSRWFVGLVFLFSSFVKGVDPLGTAYKIEEYFAAWSGSVLNFQVFLPMSTFIAVALIVCEFLVGVLLLTGAFRRLSAWLLCAMMLFFTVSTALDAFSTTYGISDCGCFGDAVKLTPLQTFLKNVVLDIPMLYILLTRNVRRRRRTERDTIITILATALMVFFCIYNINNEPCIDFRPWKKGAQMMNTDPNLKAESFTTYENIATGEQMELTTAQLMEQYNADPAFEEHWKWVSSRVVDPNEIAAPGFSMMDSDGNDYAVDFISSPDTLVIATIHHLDKVKPRGIEALQAAYAYAAQHNYVFVLLTAALPEAADAFKQEIELPDLEVYYADEKAIETMLRSNPGFIMLQDAKVLGKWHYRNIDKMTK